MKPIELTDQHKAKILEMCKYFFRGYYHIGFYSQQSNNIQMSKTTKDIIFVHWLEMCWILLNKICEEKVESPIETVNLITNFGMVCFNRSEILHPVDYLYSQYQESCQIQKS